MDGSRARLATRPPDTVPNEPVATPPNVRSATRPIDDTTHRSDPAPPPPTRTGFAPLRDVPAWSVRDGLLPLQWAVALGVGWPLVTVLSIALEPVPADPNAPVPLVIEVAGLALLFGLLITAVAAGIRHRAAAVAGVVTGLLSTTFVVACPVSGHHAFGLWWIAQLGLVAGMLAVSLVALGRSTGNRPARPARR